LANETIISRLKQISDGVSRKRLSWPGRGGKAFSPVANLDESKLIFLERKTAFALAFKP
jgi:hypothetical protein